jgi:hypothetical protein
MMGLLQWYLDTGLTFFIVLLFWLGAALVLAVLFSLIVGSKVEKQYHIPVDFTLSLRILPNYRLIGGKWIRHTAVV